MHYSKLSKTLGVFALICTIAFLEVVNAGSTNTDVSAVDNVSQGLADLPMPTKVSASEIEDTISDTSGDSGNAANVDDVDNTSHSSDSAGDDDPNSTTLSDDMQDGPDLTSSDLPQATETSDDSIAQNFHLAAGAPLWADLQLEDTESKTDALFAEATATEVMATEDSSATPTDGYSIHPRNLVKPRSKEYELHCGGKGMGHIMRTCGNAPPITGYLCQAACYCSKNGCIKCRDQDLGICSLSVMEATCRVPNVSFACACRVKGTDRTDGLAMICNNPQ